MMVEEPPVGVKPYYVAIPERIEELSTAITRYSGEGKGTIIPWAYEIIYLSMMMKLLEELRKEL